MKWKIDTDNIIVQFAEKAADLILLNVIWLISSILIVTIGASCTALYQVTVKNIRKDEGSMLSDYIKVFKRDFKQSTIFFVILGLFASLCLLAMNYLGSDSKSVLYLAIKIMLIIPLMLLPYGCAVISKFDNTTPVMLKNVFLLTIGNLPRTIGMVLIELLAGFAVYLYTPLVILTPALAVLIISYLMEPVLEKFVE